MPARWAIEVFLSAHLPYCRSGYSADEVQISGRHEETRIPDFYRVNFEVTHLKPFPYLAFPVSRHRKNSPESPSFDGELMAGFAQVLPQTFLQKPLAEETPPAGKRRVGCAGR